VGVLVGSTLLAVKDFIQKSKQDVWRKKVSLRERVHAAAGLFSCSRNFCFIK